MVLTFFLSQCFIVKLLTKPILLMSVLLCLLTSRTVTHYKVIKALPQLEGHDHDIRRSLSLSLIYRRNQLKNTKFWKCAKTINKYKEEACQRPLKELQETVPINTTLSLVERSLQETSHETIPAEDEETGFTFKPSEELLVMDGAKPVGRATFIRPSKINSDYMRLVLQGKYLNLDSRKVKLDGPNKEKYLQDIKVGEKFYWPENQLVAKACAAVAEKPKKRKKKRQPVDVDMDMVPLPVPKKIKKKKKKQPATENHDPNENHDDQPYHDHQPVDVDVDMDMVQLKKNKKQPAADPNENQDDHDDQPYHDHQPTAKARKNTKVKKTAADPPTVTVAHEDPPAGLDVDMATTNHNQQLPTYTPTNPTGTGRRKYKGYVYELVDESANHQETPQSIQEKRRPVPKKSLDFYYD